MQAPLQQLHSPLLKQHQVQLWVKREDLLHPTISGNKWRKLKYNLQEAKRQQKDTLLTFGGAYSNHIAAVAAAGAEFGFKTIGIIRGEEHLPLNPTLTFAREQGMELHYLSREQYRHKNDPEYLQQLSPQFQHPYILPEGGTNALAVEGCTEIVADIAIDYDYICCASGTGGTLAGIIAGLAGEKQLLGFPALKGGGVSAAGNCAAYPGFQRPHIQQLAINFRLPLRRLCQSKAGASGLYAGFPGAIPGSARSGIHG